MSSINEVAKGYAEARSDAKRKRRLVALLSCIVALATAIALMVPAISATKETLELEGDQASTVAASEVAAPDAADDDAADGAAAEEAAAGVAAADTKPVAGDADSDNQSTETGDAAANPAANTEASDSGETAAEEASMPAQTFTEEFKNKKDEVTFAVTVDAPEGALPEGTTMEVKKVKANDVQDAVDQAVSEKTDGKAEVKKVEAVNIVFKDADGNPVEPAADVTVTMSSAQLDTSDKDAPAPVVVTVPDEGDPAVVDQLTDKELQERDQALEDNELAFDAATGSTYAIAYTVDFEYEVGGKKYECSIDGGSSASLKSLLQKLHVVSDDQLDKMMADIVSVEFSKPEYLHVEQIVADTTVGTLKDELELECEYSADLSESDIAKLDEQALEAGDWALVSLKPFDSEESLIVTLANGETFTLKVTDAQMSTHVLAADGKDYTITVTYGPEAMIPDESTLTARELEPETDEYKEHYQQAIDVVQNGETADTVLDSEDQDSMLNELSELGLTPVRFGDGVDIKDARFFDIKIVADGQEIEPAAPVTVSISYDEPIAVDEGAQPEVVHFASDGPELIEPVMEGAKGKEAAVASFEFEQSSFSITATLLKYTSDITPGKYVIIKGVNENKVDRFYALTSNGSTVEITRNSDKNTYSNIPDDCAWSFTRQDDGTYVIENDRHYSWLTLYNGITGTWNQHIVVSPSGEDTAVQFRNPNNTALRWDGTNKRFILAGQGDSHADSFYIARVNTDIPQGQGKDLKPAAETGLGDLEAWKDKITSRKVIADKTAKVVDYDNRIYQIDLEATSDISMLTNTIDLELITDTSRSMYFPATLEPVSGATFKGWDGLANTVNRLDKNKIYYFVGDGETATVYALYYAASGTNMNDKSGAEKWRFVDSSYMNPPDAKTMNEYDRLNRLVGVDIEDHGNRKINAFDASGNSRLYTSPDDITRLAYLKEAVRIAAEIVYGVDPNSRIGLVTFNKEAKPYQGFTGAKQKDQLFSKITNIGLAGGTRQDLGIQEGVKMFNGARAEAQKVAILITDGAPNMRDGNNQQIPSDTAWRMISTEADNLKDPNSTNAKLYTLGLSMQMVGGNNSSHLAGLASSGDGITRHYNAESGAEIATAVKALMETLVHDVDVKGDVKDALDPAFYPVDKDGNPIEPGEYTDLDGTKYTWSKITDGGVEYWQVTYKDQNISRGQRDSGDNVTAPGWQKSFFVKAKEDFLGGNVINTNSAKRKYDLIEVRKCIYTDKVTGEKTEINPPNGLSWPRFTSPTVNVDELHLTEHSTEWTVYLGTKVDPKAQLEELWNNIRVKQVAKENGTTDNGMIVKPDQMYYEHSANVDASDKAAPDSGYASLGLDHYGFGNETRDAILQAIKNRQNYDSGAIAYSAYGHNNVGTIRITATKQIDPDAADAQTKAPDEHVTDKTGDKIEQYKIVVTYTPVTDGAADSYEHTTPGGSAGRVTTGTGADEVKSDNNHIINVFAKKLQLQKIDIDGHPLTADPAKFQLYKPDENGQGVDGLPAGKYVPVGGELVANGEGAWTTQTGYLPIGEYWLVETHAPNGYNKVSPLRVTVTASGDVYEQVVETATEDKKPIGYTWTQKAALNIDGGTIVNRVGQTAGAGAEPDSITATVQYQVKNSPGHPLPNTGGPGTVILYTLGTLMVAVAAAVLLRRRTA